MRPPVHPPELPTLLYSLSSSEPDPFQQALEPRILPEKVVARVRQSKRWTSHGRPACRNLVFSLRALPVGPNGMTPLAASGALAYDPIREVASDAGFTELSPAGLS